MQSLQWPTWKKEPCGATLSSTRARPTSTRWAGALLLCSPHRVWFPVPTPPGSCPCESRRLVPSGAIQQDMHAATPARPSARRPCSPLGAQPLLAPLRAAPARKSARSSPRKQSGVRLQRNQVAVAAYLEGTKVAGIRPPGPLPTTSPPPPGPLPTGPDGAAPCSVDLKPRSLSKLLVLSLLQKS
ncbi:hypothetical protein EJB05_54997, partial [Eragrostis curvula]